MNTPIALLVITFLILLNGIFVAAEFAILGVRRTRIAQLAESGNATAQRVQAIVESPARTDRYIASAQLGITLASLGLGMYGEPAIAHLIEPPLHDWLGLSGDIVHTISFLIGLSLITYLHVVIGEMIPKSIALHSAEQVVFALATPMLLMEHVLAYPITALNKIGLFVLWLMRVPPPDEGSRLHTPDELELIVSDSVVGGLIESEEQTLIANIFDFSHLYVGQIMTPRIHIEAVPVTSSKEDLLEKMFSLPYTRLPVYEHDLDHILGVIHLKDLVHHHLEHTTFDLAALLHPVPFVPERLQADRLLARMKRLKTHLAIVLDEYGGTAGLVTLEDLIEEVVGEVHDEFDMDEEPIINMLEPGHMIVSGEARLHEVKPFVNLQTEDLDVDTVGGLLMARVKLPPRIGAEIQVNDATLRVEALDGLTIQKVSITYAPDMGTSGNTD